jgi:uncharacterized protein (UPF0335 family)
MTKPTAPEHGDNARLKSIVDRVERLETERKGLGDDIKDVFKEAKSVGYEIPVLKQVLKLRKMEASDRQERETLIDLYMQELGMLATTPLGQAEIAKIA